MSDKSDKVLDILNIAVSVLADYGTEDGDTRIERMARWLVLNLLEATAQPLVSNRRHNECECEEMRRRATALFISVERSES